MKLPHQTYLASFLLALALLFSGATAIDLSKEVTNASIIDIGDILHVKIDISSNESIYIQKLVDPIPENFQAINYPESCAQTEKELVCNFGYSFSGKTSIEYDLKAISPGIVLILAPQLYYEGGIKTIDFVRLIRIGRARPVLSFEGNHTYLPYDHVLLGIEITNQGSMPLSGAKLVTTFNRSTVLNKSLSLGPGEVRRLEVDLGPAPEAAKVSVAEVCLYYGNISKCENYTFAVVKPGLSATRKVSTEWFLTKDNRLDYRTKVVYKLRNNGTATAVYVLSTGETFTVEPGEAVEVEKYYKDHVEAMKIGVYDVKHRIYFTKVFEAVDVKPEKGFIVRYYEAFAYKINPYLALMIALIALYLAIKKKDHEVLSLAFLLIALVFGLVFLAHYAVKAVVVPKPNLQPSENLSENLLRNILSKLI